LRPRLIVAGECVPPELELSEELVPETLRDAFAIDASGSLIAQWPGVYWLRRALVVLPRFYGEVPADLRARRRAVELLHDVLTTYRRACPTRIAVREVAGSLEDPILVGQPSETALDAFEASHQLLADWRRSGPLPIPARLRSTQHRGRIHWRSSLREGRPVDSEEGDAVFRTLVQTRVRIDPGHEMRLLHQGTVADIAWRWGEPGHEPPQRLAPREALKILDRYGARLFEERQRYVCVLLRTYYEGLQEIAGGPTRKLHGLAAKSFPHVWEHMLQVVLGASVPAKVRDLYSFGFDPIGEVRKPLNPDIVFRRSGLLYVLDAKDYQGAKQEPTGDAFKKQLLYGLLLSGLVRDGAASEWIVEVQNLRNGFAFPSVGPPTVAVRGVWSAKEILPAALPFGILVSLEINYERVAQAYTRYGGRVDPDLRAGVADTLNQQTLAKQASLTA
jgi:hypothetical protein